MNMHHRQDVKLSQYQSIRHHRAETEIGQAAVKPKATGLII